jgi:RNA polymerase sigma-70 factor (ECF subfamily)
MIDMSEFIPTRQSLLSRLRDWNDEESWNVFFDTYWKLIYSAATKAGLTDSEAQDVVQETVLSVSKSMPGFHYDSEKGSFKTWLMRLTGWRIVDQLRKRDRGLRRTLRTEEILTDTPTIERIADPVGSRLEKLWEEEWETNLMEAAIERIRRKVDPEQYQIFDLYVLKQWPVSKVARTLKVNPGKVYLIKHRINRLIKREISRLQMKLI